MSYEIFHVNERGVKNSFSFAGSGFNAVCDEIMKNSSHYSWQPDNLLGCEIAKDMGYLWIDKFTTEELLCIINSLKDLISFLETKNIKRGEADYAHRLSMQGLLSSLETEYKRSKRVR